jgi:hypothetical protein
VENNNKFLDQVFRVALLALAGSKNPVEDLRRITQIRSTRPPPISAMSPTQLLRQDNAPTTLGRNFETRFTQGVLPKVALNLNVGLSSLYRFTRHVGHCGDLSINYGGKIGLVELKNHSKSLPLNDRRRFFDSVLINTRHIHWAMIITSTTSIPGYGEKGYVTAGILENDLIEPKISLPVSFVCGLYDPHHGKDPAEVVTSTIRLMQSRPQGGLTIKASELIKRKELTENLKPRWNSQEGKEIFTHPRGSVL